MQLRSYARCLAIAAAALVAPSQAFAQASTTPNGVRLVPLELPQMSAFETRNVPGVSSPRAESLTKSIVNAKRRMHEVRDASTPEQRGALKKLRERVGDDLHVRFRPGVGTPMEIKGRDLMLAATSLVRAGESRAQATAREFLTRQAPLLRVDDPESELALVSEEVDNLDRAHLRYQQVYQGLEVWPGELIVHLDPDGDVDRLSGSFRPTPRNAVTVARVAASTATDSARIHIGGGMQVGEPKLLLFTPQTGSPTLAYRVELSQSLTRRYEVLVSAQTGDVLRSHNLIANENVVGSGVDLSGATRTLNVWNTGSNLLMADTSKAMFDNTSNPADANQGRGVIYVFDANNEETNSVAYINSPNANSWPIRDSVSAAFNLSEVYDYYEERHSRNSLDGRGGNMFAIVRFGANFENAFWDGTSMYFGDGLPFAGALDVVAHELTHGVVTHTANLEYLNESGALNESFADVLGESAESRTEGSLDWLLGTALPSPFRNMRNPGALSTSLGPYPSKMSEFYTLDADTDNGGVHINSSIPNHCFYLLAEGQSNAIGLEKTERIFYRALTTSLTKNSRFIDARLACISAAEDLFGMGSNEANATAAAFAAVEIGDAGGTDAPPDTTPVTGDDSTIFVYRDSMSGDYLLGRREIALGDNGAIGNPLYFDSGGTPLPIAPTRPSISGDGSFMIFVDATSTAVLLDTETSVAARLSGDGDELVGQISSVAMAPDGEHYGFVFLNGDSPSNEIVVIDISTEPGTSTGYTLQTPQSETNNLNTVLYADAMTFSADNRLLYYDALNELSLNTVSVLKGTPPSLRVWSIYALDLLSGTTLSVVPPTPGVETGYPSLAQTNDNFIVFDALDSSSGRSTIFAGDLATGELSPVGDSGGGFGVPSFNGDDSAIHFSQFDDSQPTDYSLMRQAVTNRTVVNGTPELWIPDSDFGRVYRRGSYSIPNAPPQGEINTPVISMSIDVGDSVAFTGTGSDSNGHNPLSFDWNFDGGAPASSSEDPGPVTFNTAGTYTVRFTVTDSLGLPDPTPHTRTITVGSTATGGGGGGGCAMNPNAAFDPTLLVLIALAIGWRLRRRRLENAR